MPKGKTKKEWGKEAEKLKLVLLFRLCIFHYKVYFCVMCAGIFAVNTLLSADIQAVAYESVINSQFFKSCIKKLVLKSSICIKMDRFLNVVK